MQPLAAPRFSVVVPLYNKQAHIAATLASVAVQTYDPFEVIVVDDGSTDDSASMVRAANLPRLRIVAQANAGPACARNRGIAEAAGDWIAFLDADDLWLPDHLETLAGLIDAYPAADVVSSGYVRARRIAMPERRGDEGDESRLGAQALRRRRHRSFHPRKLRRRDPRLLPSHRSALRGGARRSVPIPAALPARRGLPRHQEHDRPAAR